MNIYHGQYVAARATYMCFKGLMQFGELFTTHMQVPPVTKVAGQVLLNVFTWRDGHVKTFNSSSVR
jgi:hypothetical protein